MNSGLHDLLTKTPRKLDENLEAVMPPQPHEGFSEAVVKVAIEKLDSDTFSVRQSGAFKLDSILSRMNSPKDLYEFGPLIENNIEAFKETDTTKERTDRLRLLSKSLKDKILNMIIEDVQKKDGEIKFGRNDPYDLVDKPDSTHPEIMFISFDRDRDPYLAILALQYTNNDHVKMRLLGPLEDHVDTVENALVGLMSADNSESSLRVFELLFKSKNPEIITAVKDFIKDELNNLSLEAFEVLFQSKNPEIATVVKDFIKSELNNPTLESFEKWRDTYLKFDKSAVFEICMDAMNSKDSGLAQSAEAYLISNFRFITDDEYRSQIIDLIKERNDTDLLANRLQYGSNDSEVDQKNRLEFLADQNIPMETRLLLLRNLESWLTKNHVADSQLRTVISALEIDDPVIVEKSLSHLSSWADFVKKYTPYIKEEHLDYLEMKKQEVNSIAISYLDSSNIDINILSQAIKLYEAMNEKTSETKLSDFLTHDSEEVRFVAASCILKYSDSNELIDIFKSTIKSSNINHQLEALEILIKKDKIATAEVIESITNISDNSIPFIEKKAEILGLIQSERAVDLLIELAEKTNDLDTILKIVDAIVNQGAFAEKALPHLEELEQKYQSSFKLKHAVENVKTISLLNSEKPEHQLEAVEILLSGRLQQNIQMSDKELVTFIRDIDNSSQELIIRKAGFLEKIDSEQSTELLFELLKLENNLKTAQAILEVIAEKGPISKSQKLELDKIRDKYTFGALPRFPRVHNDSE